MARRASARLPAVVGVCVAAIVLAGCEISIGGSEKTVTQSSEVAQARKTLAALPDLPPAKSIDCPDDVDAKVDTTYQCTATFDNGQQVVLPARVASVGAEQTVELVTNLDVVQEATAVDIIYRGANTTPDSIDCPSDVEASVGKTIDCQVTFPNGAANIVTLKVETTTPRQNLRITHIGKA